MSRPEPAATRGSGRVGRSTAGRALNPSALELAVIASVRHRGTRYDELLMSGIDRHTTRAQVADQVARTLEAWAQRPPDPPSPRSRRATALERSRRAAAAPLG